MHGTKIANAFVNVWDQPPVISKFMALDTKVAEGQSLRLPCLTVGAPKAIIQWTKNGKVLGNSHGGTWNGGEGIDSTNWQVNRNGELITKVGHRVQRLRAQL